MVTHDAAGIGISGSTHLPHALSTAAEAWVSRIYLYTTAPGSQKVPGQCQVNEEKGKRSSLLLIYWAKHRKESMTH